MECLFVNTTRYSYPVLDDAAPGYDPGQMRRRGLCAGAGLLLLIGAVALVWQRSLVSLLCIPVLVVALGFVGYAWISGRVMRTSFRSKMLQSALSRQVECWFFQEDFLVRAGEEEQRLDYNAVTRWYARPGTVTLCLGDEVLVLDRKGFSQGEDGAFVRFLSAKAVGSAHTRKLL